MIEKPHPPGTTDDRDFLAGYDASRFPHPSVAVDVAIVTASGGRLRALLVRRAEAPQRGRHALPGGFVRMDESLDEAAHRLLSDKGGLREVFLEQLYTFGAPRRDPRTRVITVAYYALVHPEKLAAAVETNGDTLLAALEVPWTGESGGTVQAHTEDGRPLPLAFDHGSILGMVVQRLRGKLDYADVGFELLPDRFTLRDLQRVHETILGRALNKDSFRRRMLAAGRLVATGRREREVGHRPAELYRFRRATAAKVR